MRRFLKTSLQALLVFVLLAKLDRCFVSPPGRANDASHFKLRHTGRQSRHGSTPKTIRHYEMTPGLGLQLPQDLADRDLTRIGTLDVPVLGIGTISWGLRGFGGVTDWLERTVLQTVGGVNSADAVALASLLKGVNFFETAERYGNSASTAIGLGYGETEHLLGRVLKSSGMPAMVATKFTPNPWRTSVESVVEACEASRQRLDVPIIDLYQIQMPDIVHPFSRVPWLPKEWSEPKDEIYWEGLIECKKRGIVANVGVSNYGPTLIRRAHAFFQARGVQLASNQISYSLLYRSSGAQDTVDVCKELGIKVLGYFPLAMGVLTGKWKSDDLYTQMGVGPVGEPINPELTGKSSLEQLEIAETARKAAPLLKELERIAKDRDKTVSQVALNWVICKGVVPIPGARTAQQAIDNAGALGWRLTPSEVAALEEAADEADCEFQGAGFKRCTSKFVGYGFEEWKLE
eukprot:TRINITY_DN29824_c0_g1_i2.p1 TRINITY_DN29824_c0_g1~~TRINITY_DN29824_c0_g1_i2.p1  ORF type:complete len:461 (+),score=71.85 TRINITY_DN29824_c0_g1_i2:91-1473(+)